jgi:two-component system, response regulator YesN
MKKRKLFWQMLMYFGVFIILFSSVTTFLLYKDSSEVYQKERSQQQKILLEQAKKSIDTRIQVAFNALMQLQNSQEFKDYIRSNQKNEYYYRMLQVLKQLKINNSAFANFEYKSGILNLADNVVVTQDSTMNREMFFKELGFSKKNIAALEGYVHKSTPHYGKHQVMIISNENNSEYLTLIKKETNFNNVETLFFISFYAKSFFSFVEGEGKEGFGLVTKDEIKYLQTDLEFAKVEDILKPKELAKLDELSFEHGSVTTGKAGYDIHLTQSDILSNLNYVYFSPKPVSIAAMKEVYVKAFMIGLSLLAAGILLAAYFVNRTYRPIQHIIHHLSQYQKYEGNDELSFIKSTTDQISIMNENLKQTIELNKLPLKQQFLNEMVLGPMNQKEFTEKLNRFHTKVKQENLKVIIIEVDSNVVLQERLSKEGILSVKQQILGILKKEIEPMFACELFEYGYEKIVLIIHQEDVENIVSKLGLLFSRMNKELELNIITAVGQPVAKLENIYHSFESALKILESKFALERNTVLSYEDFKYLDQTNFYFPFEVERSLIQLVVQGNFEKAEIILNRVLEENLHSKKLTKNALSQFVFAIRGTINRILQAANKTSKEIFGDEISTFHFELQQIHDKDQLEERIRLIFSVLLTQISTTESKEETSIATKFLKYIQQNYEKDISLHDLADEFGLSTSYISTIFKNHTGENYKDYLNKYRISKAQEILENREIKIKELAGMVGFNNVNTFIRTFKRYVGLPPGQYEKSS